MERWNNWPVLKWLSFSEAYLNERAAIASIVKIGSAPGSEGSTVREHKQSGFRGKIARHFVLIINAQHGHLRYGDPREQQTVLVDEIKMVEANELGTIRVYEVGNNVRDAGCQGSKAAVGALLR
jgi:hypothetical protein